jgi:hypothetical protein
MAGITVRTFRELLKRKLVKGLGLIVLLLIAGSMVIFFAIPPGRADAARWRRGLQPACRQGRR